MQTSKLVNGGNILSNTFSLLNLFLFLDFFIYEKLQDKNDSPIEGMGLGLFTIITMIVQWAMILIIFIFVLNNRVADATKKGPVSDGNFDDDVEWAEKI